MAQLEHIEAIERRLWSAADTLRANSNYASNEYFLPVMGLVFLRHAYSRFLGVKDAIEASLPTRGGKIRPLSKEDFSQKNAIFLQPKAQFDTLVALPDNADRAKAIIDAMESIEADYENLRGVLPKSEYQELDNAVLGQLLRTLNPEELKQVSGDVFGRIYEYFLTQFADQKAHDGGEFFTPVSLVSLIANVIEPAGGTVLDPACGSGGMFVQSARVVERRHENPTEKLTFYGLEKNATTIRLAKMNLAVHGLEGDIQKAITYYEDPHELLRKADFVMANPPFNVDEIDADKVKNDPRLPFGLPGVNKKGKVSNGNYVWISYFYSYLNEQGRAGFVMSSQASSAGRDEAKVRQKLVETGDVDVMVAIRSNFFYTRTVPCELWFIDRGKLDQPSPPTPLPRGEGDHYRGGFDFSGLVKRARELRKKQTPAEQILWDLLRSRKFSGFKFRRQHQVGDYILDFYCHEARLGVELDGSIHKKRVEKDKKRDAYLKSQGIQVVRIPNDTLLHETASALEQIAALLPSPSGREGRGEGHNVAQRHKGNILMIDARNIYRKVTRKIYDFSPEQEQNLLAIVWLYRGETRRYLDLVAGYCQRMLAEGAACFTMKDDTVESVEPLPDFISALATLRGSIEPFLKVLAEDSPAIEALKELDDAILLFKADVESFRKSVSKQQAAWKQQKTTNGELKRAVNRLASLAETSRDLVKQTDLLYKLACRLIEICENEYDAKCSDTWSTRDIIRTRKAADEARTLAVEQLKQVRYFWKQAHWLTERFSEAKLCDVEGLVKLVDRTEIKANDWSLTPGRYVGVAPEEEDEDFDFEEALRDIHVELEDLNTEAVQLAAIIKKNFKELGI
jgi:type I restriction-modification system DNA methylase subunit/very-short-patch-repair endonuclease